MAQVKDRRSRKVSKKKKEMKETFVVVGYRKKAIARGYVTKTSDSEIKIRVNSKPLEYYFPSLLLYRIKEPIFLVGEDKLKGISIDINVKGGGVTGQSDAVRQVIAKSLVEIYGDDVKKRFLEHDRSLIVPDVRQTEPHKPSRSKQGPRRKKQLSKR